MALPAGTRIGPYELLELLGAGGMGEVYRARDPRLGREVAVKVLPERFAHSADRLHRFEREARTAGALNHPNILTVFDVGSQDGIPYLVCELLEGETLQTLLRYQRMGVRQSLLFALQVARGLACAHEAGILHRDLKPGNLFLTRDGRLKILDFGLAKLVQPESGVSPQARTATRDTDAGRLLGTAAYMSPEQIRDEPLDGRCDIFALGAILYELMSRRPAFTGASESDVMASVLRDEPPAFEALGTGVPTGVEGMVRRCLEKRREDRFGSARELAAALQALLESLDPALAEGAADLAADQRPVPLLKAPGAPTLIAASRRRFPRAGILAAVAVSTLIGLALLQRWRAAPPPAAPGSLAVMSFENLSDRTDADNLGRMLGGLLATDLAGSEALQVVSSQRLYDIARQLGKAEGTPDRTVATDVARRAGATKMVLGQVARVGPRMVATVELVEVGSGRRLGSYRAEGTSTQDVFSMAEGLGAHLRANMTGGPLRPGGGTLTRQLTTSADAYRAYVRGEALLHRWDVEKAVEEFRQAVKLDPEFALAHYRLSTMPFARSGLPTEPEAQAAAKRAAALKDKLPARYQDLVEGNFLYLSGRISKAMPLLESALARDRDNKELLYVLSECYMHSARDTDPRRAAELMEEILALDPDFHMVYNHLAIAYALLGEFAKAHERLDGWEPKEPDLVRLTRSYVCALEGRLDEALRWSERLEGPIIQGYTRASFGLAAGRWDVARSMIRKYKDLWLLQACLHLNLGEFEQARSLLRRHLPARLEPDDGPFGAWKALALQLLAGLSELHGDPQAAHREAEQALQIQPEGSYCLYFAGLFAIRAGDLPSAERHLRTLEDVTNAARGPLPLHYRDALRGEVALARGRALDAQALIENAVNSRTLYYEFLSSNLPGAAFREALARAYLAGGDKKKAAQALERLIDSGYESYSDPVRRVRALYTLGKLRLELGDRAGGREMLQRFLAQWGKADWDLPEVRDARARLRSSAL